MIRPKYLPFVLKHITRHRWRSVLTVFGVGTAMFLFCGVRAMHEGVQEATVSTAGETTLVVYRQNRFCPFTSKLPQDYGRQIAGLPGVDSVVPMKIMVGNCRASLDVITFRGVPAEDFDSVADHLQVVEGSVAEWRKRSDAALIGLRAATRRGLRVGDRLEIAGVTITIAGIVESTRPQDQDSAFTHLDFLQRSSGAGLGEVTQFNVTVLDPTQLDAVAGRIDELFATAQDPTATWSEKAFTARAVTDIIELAGFAAWLGWGALAAVFALAANAIILSVQERVRDHAVLQTLGFGSRLIARLIIVESALLSLLGGAIGIAAAAAALHWGRFSLSVEGQSIQANTDPATVVLGLVYCLVLGVGAGLFPAWQASRRDIVTCFRAV
ncbi:MAG: putative ABC transport system permease protein [Rhodothermales bacterium]|jgi:putative ABC transport system permease protein